MFLMTVGANQLTVIAGVLFKLESLRHVAAYALYMGFFRQFDFEGSVRIAVTDQALR